VLPPVVTGYLLLLSFGRRGVVGAWLADHLGIVFAFRWTGAALAAGDVVSAIGTADPAVDRGDRPPAGAGRRHARRRTLAVFATVTLPWRCRRTGRMVLGFAKAIGEFGATITFVSNIPGETQTISSAIYSLIQPRWRQRGGTAGHHLHRDRDGALIASEWFARRATQRLHGN